MEARPASTAFPDLELGTFFRVGIGNDVHRLAAAASWFWAECESRPRKVLSATRTATHWLTPYAMRCSAPPRWATLDGISPTPRPNGATCPASCSFGSIRKLLRDAGYSIVNIDATVSLEAPKLAPHIPRMQKKLAAALGLDAGQISVKAKTGEGLDAVGRGEAVRADAIALISRRLCDSQAERYEAIGFVVRRCPHRRATGC